MKPTHILLSILFCSLILPSVIAQNMNLKKTNGATELYALYNISSLKFTDTTMDIKNNSGITVSKNITDINILTFSEIVQSIQEQNKFVSNAYQLITYPNPSSNLVTIAYSVNTASPVEIKIYTINGELVKQVNSGIQQAGNYTCNWDTTDNNGVSVSNGTYNCKVISNSQVMTNKIIIIK